MQKAGFIEVEILGVDMGDTVTKSIPGKGTSSSKNEDIG